MRASWTPSSRPVASSFPSRISSKVAFNDVSVRDARRARPFYQDVLGLRRGLASPDGVWTDYDLPGGGCLALSCHPRPKRALLPEGGANVAFEVAVPAFRAMRLQPAAVLRND